MSCRRLLAAAAFAAPLALAFALPASAQRVSPITGGKLLGVCTGGGSAPTACDAYVSGIADTVALMQAMAPESHGAMRVPAIVCIPGPTTGVQLRQTVVTWLRRNPNMASQQAAPLVVRALREAYPCPKAPV